MNQMEQKRDNDLNYLANPLSSWTHACDKQNIPDTLFNDIEILSRNIFFIMNPKLADVFS